MTQTLRLKRAAPFSFLFTLLLVSACDSFGCGLDLERMGEQPRLETFAPCKSCPGGTVMQQPPPGTIPFRPRDLAAIDIDPEASARAIFDTPPAETAHQWSTSIPITVDRSLVMRGQNRFSIFCAACHGRLSDGNSPVAPDMALRWPPSLIQSPIADYPPGRIYQVITYGFGLMPSYAAALTVRYRWAVIAYLGALTLTKTNIDALDPARAAVARKALTP